MKKSRQKVRVIEGAQPLSPPAVARSQIDNAVAGHKRVGAGVGRVAFTHNFAGIATAALPKLPV